jgi:hypothetical protein
MLMPAVALAGDPIPGVDVKNGKNPGGQTAEWTQTCKTGGGIPIPAGGTLAYCAKADAVDTCKSKGGTVVVMGGQAVCNLPK